MIFKVTVAFEIDAKDFGSGKNDLEKFLEKAPWDGAHIVSMQKKKVSSGDAKISQSAFEQELMDGREILNVPVVESDINAEYHWKKFTWRQYRELVRPYQEKLCVQRVVKTKDDSAWVMMKFDK